MKQISCFLICMVVSSAGLAAINSYALEINLNVRGTNVISEEADIKLHENQKIYYRYKNDLYVAEYWLKEPGKTKDGVLISLNLFHVADEILHGNSEDFYDGLHLMMNPKFMTLSGLEGAIETYVEDFQIFSLKVRPTLVSSGS